MDNKIELRFFITLYFTLFVVYAFVDLLTNPQIQSFGYSLFLDHTPLEILQLIDANLLLAVREASTLTKVSIFSFIGLISYGLTFMVMQPMRFIAKQRKFFIANAAHELNTPLAVIRATAELTQMQRKKLGAGEIEQFTSSVIEEVDSMSKIIAAFLRFAPPIKRSQSRMSFVSTSSIITKVVRALTALAKEHGVAIEVKGKGSGIVWGNFNALVEMIHNITKNAIIHSSEGGVVTLAFHERYNHVALSVADNGVGIASEDLPYIFDPFYKGENALRGGHGLGLTVVKEIALMHFAHIDIETKPKKGTTFNVRLPK